MYHLPHLGELAYRECIDHQDASVAEAAERRDKDLRQIPVVAQSHASVTLKVAQRRSLVLGSTTEMWLLLEDSDDNAPVRKATNNISGTRNMA